MRLPLLLVTLFAGVVLAQETPPPPPPAAQPAAADQTLTPPPPPVSAQPEATTPGPALADKTATPARFSKFSAGRGGALFAFAEGLDGLILGGMAGSGGSLGPGSGAFLGALAGGVLLGGGATIVQAIHPIGLASAGTIALGIGVGALAGFGISTAATISSFLTASLIALGVSQVGMLVPLIALWNVDDIPGEDLAVMGMTSTYAFVLTGLTTLLFNTIPGSARTAAVLFAPAFGMALGALWASAVDLSPGRVLKLTALPLGIGALTFFLGALLTLGNMPIVAAATLVTTTATFGLTYFFTAEEPAPAKTAGLELSPSITMLPGKSASDPHLVGPAIIGRF